MAITPTFELTPEKLKIAGRLVLSSAIASLVLLTLQGSFIGDMEAAFFYGAQAFAFTFFLSLGLYRPLWGGWPMLTLGTVLLMWHLRQLGNLAPRSVFVFILAVALPVMVSGALFLWSFRESR